jgi:hypothetical protein
VHLRSWPTEQRRGGRSGRVRVSPGLYGVDWGCAQLFAIGPDNSGRIAGGAAGLVASLKSFAADTAGVVG